MITRSLLVYVFLLGVQGEDDQPESAVQRVREHLLKGYDINARPSLDYDAATVVEAGLTPTHISEVNENTGTLSLEGWMHLSWIDDHLKWDPKNFSGVKSITFREREIWKPDLTVFNGQGSRFVSFWRVKALVTSKGNVTWNQPASMQLICNGLDYSNYPADIQSCRLKLGSWTHDDVQLDLKIKQEELSLEFYQSSANPHWNVLGIKGEKVVQKYPCCEDPYISVDYKLTMQRRNVPYSALCSIPNIVAKLLILCMFWIPNGTRKLALGCTSLLTLTLIGACVTSNLPSPAAAPAALYEINTAMALCITAIIVEIAVSTMASCLWSSPRCLDVLVSSTFCRLLNPCEPGHETTLDVQYTEGIAESQDNFTESKTIPPKRRVWAQFSLIVDRLAFVFFGVLLLAL